MRQLFGASLLAFGLVFRLCSLAASAEEQVLSALQNVKEGVEQGLSHEKLVELLDAAKGEVTGLQKGIGNSCFRVAARRSYDWYVLGVRSWASLIENEKQRDKYARQAEYGEHHLKVANLTIADNYSKLVRHAQDALPSKWAYGEAQLQRAHECLKRPEHQR